MNKPPFDPSQPFDAPSKPAFDPSQPVDLDSPSMLQKAAQLTAVPRNGLRAIATGAQSLIEGHGLQPSLADAAAAAQPDYKKPAGDYGTAGFVANALDPRMLATMLVPGGIIAQGAAAGAAGSGLSDIENTGTTSAGSVLGGAALGGVTGGALKGVGALAAKAPQIVSALGKSGKGFLTTAAMLRQGIPAAYDALAAENPAALKAAAGTFESQRASAQALQDGIAARLAALREPVQSAKADLGITPAAPADYNTILQNAKQVLNKPIPQPAHSPVGFAAAADANKPMLALPAPAPTIPLPGVDVTGPAGVQHIGEPYYRYNQMEPEFNAGQPVTQPSRFLPPVPETINRPNGQLSSDYPEQAWQAENNLDRVRQINVLKSQIKQLETNAFKNGDASVLPKDVNPDAAKSHLAQLYGQLNAQQRVIPEAQVLNAANADFSPAKSAYDDVLQKQFGQSSGGTQARISSLTTPLEDTRPEAVAADVKNAINTVGGDVPALYQAAQAEAVKRAMDLPISSATRSTVKRLASAPFRLAYPYALPAISSVQNASAPLAQALSSGAQKVQPVIPSLIEALMANSKHRE